MKCLILFLFTFVFTLYGEGYLSGRVLLNDYYGPCLPNIVVKAQGTNEQTTDSTGWFQLKFATLKPGDKVVLSISGRDSRNNALAIANYRALESLRIPSDPQSSCVKIVLKRTSDISNIQKLEKELLKHNLNNISELASNLATIKKVHELEENHTSKIVNHAFGLIADSVSIDSVINYLQEPTLKEAYDFAINGRNRVKKIKTVIDAYKLKASLLKSQTRNKEARQCYERIIEIYDEHKFNPIAKSFTYLEVVKVEQLNNLKSPLVFQYRQKAIDTLSFYSNELRPELIGVYSYLAKYHSNNKSFSLAYDYTAKAIQIHKKYHRYDDLELSSLYLQSSHIYKKNRQYEIALSDLKKAIELREKKAPNSLLVEMYVEAGEICSFLKKNILVVQYYQKAINLCEKNNYSLRKILVKPYLKTAEYYYKNSDNRTALSNYSKAINILEYNVVQNRLLLAQTYVKLGTVYESLSLLEKNEAYEKSFLSALQCLELAGEHYNVLAEKELNDLQHMTKFARYRAINNCENFILLFDTYCKMGTMVLNANFPYADVKESVNDLKKTLDRAKTLLPKSGKTHISFNKFYKLYYSKISAALVQEKKYAQALLMYDSLSQYSSNSLNYEKGLCYFHLGRYSRAIDYLNKCQRGDEKSDTLYWCLSLAHLRRYYPNKVSSYGLSKASRYIGEFEKETPDGHRTLYLKAVYYSSMKNKNETISLLEKVFLSDNFKDYYREQDFYEVNKRRKFRELLESI